MVDIQGNSTLIERYWESVRPSYEQLDAWVSRAESPPVYLRVLDNLVSPFAFFATLNAVPLIPLTVSRALVGDGPLEWSDLPIVLVVWAVLAVLAVLAFRFVRSLARQHVPSRQQPPTSLTPSQLTFAHAYLAKKSLDAYLATSIDSQLSACIEHARRMFHPSVGRWGRVVLNSGTLLIEGRFRRVTQPGWPGRLASIEGALRLAKQYDWFQLDDRTQGRIETLLSLGPKVLPRLTSKQDLAQVSDALECFATFTYWAARRETDRTADDDPSDGSADSLSSLQTVLEALPIIQDAAGGAVASVPDQATKALRRRVLESTGFRFVAWTSVTMLLTGVCALGAKLFLQISDDTLALISIPTAVTSGAALAVLTNRNPSEP